MPNDIYASFDTTEGKFKVKLFADKAPKTVENFVSLADGNKTGKPFYNGTVFHRVIPDFMIQGGDPAGNGTGDPGYKFKDEISDVKFDRPGRLAMANSGPNTNGSQFFITEGLTPHLNGKHTIFGQCEPLELVKHIARMPRDPNTDKPFNAVRIKHIEIVEAGAAEKPAAKPAAKK
jgi:cyclophilin family peptidyl-prolyl cis-trans isomerase